MNTAVRGEQQAAEGPRPLPPLPLFFQRTDNLPETLTLPASGAEWTCVAHLILELQAGLARLGL
jgi:hypothetical protein